MQRALHDNWWRLVREGPRTVPEAMLLDLLGGVSLVFGTGVAARNRGYASSWLRARQAGCPVVSVGNLSVGGTGKTICVAFLGQKLRQRYTRLAVLSRGYGSRGRYWLRMEEGRLRVHPLRGGLGLLADEPQVLARRLGDVPVVVGADRARLAQWAVRELGADALLLDDGFQHRRLARDCDVVLVNATMPLGGWPLLPRGPMREPVEALRRADIVIATRADQAWDKLGAWRERVRALNPSAVFATAAHALCGLTDAAGGGELPGQLLAGKRVAAVSSLGDPRSFETTLQQARAMIIRHDIFPDHHPYTPVEWKSILDQAVRARAEALITTEKDWARLSHFATGAETPLPVWLARVELKLLSGEKELDARLARL